MLFIVILLIIAGVILFLAGRSMANKKAGVIFKTSGIAGIILALVILALSSFYVINPGEVGVEVLFGKVQRYSDNGMHFKNPLSEVIIFDIKTQRELMKSEGASQDLQVVYVEAVINYRLDESKLPELYSKIGHDFLNKIIIPATQESIKAAVARYKVEEVIVKRHEVKQLIQDELFKKLSHYYIVLEEVNIQDINFSKEFNKVVEEKQIEEQKIKTAEYRRQQAEQDKQRTILMAQGEAEKQRLLKVNTSKEVIELKWIEKWDGHLPQNMFGGNSIPMVNVSGK